MQRKQSLERIQTTNACKYTVNGTLGVLRIKLNKWTFLFRLSGILAHDMRTHRIHYEQHMCSPTVQFFYVPSFLKCLHSGKRKQPAGSRRVDFILKNLAPNEATVQDTTGEPQSASAGNEPAAANTSSATDEEPSPANRVASTAGQNIKRRQMQKGE